MRRFFKKNGGDPERCGTTGMAVKPQVIIEKQVGAATVGELFSGAPRLPCGSNCRSSPV